MRWELFAYHDTEPSRTLRKIKIHIPDLIQAKKKGCQICYAVWFLLPQYLPDYVYRVHHRLSHTDPVEPRHRTLAVLHHDLTDVFLCLSRSKPVRVDVKPAFSIVEKPWGPELFPAPFPPGLLPIAVRTGQGVNTHYIVEGLDVDFFLYSNRKFPGAPLSRSATRCAFCRLTKPST